MKAPGIMLTPLTQDDLHTMLAWVNNREQRILNASYTPVHESQHRAWFDAIQQRQDTVIFGIRISDSSKLIGTCQLHSIHMIHRTAELQIRIGEIAERGHGYGTQAICKLLDFAFKDLNLNRVYLHVFASNESAIRAYEKTGFVREGSLRQHAHIDGKHVDVIVMGILREEFYAS